MMMDNGLDVPLQVRDLAAGVNRKPSRVLARAAFSRLARIGYRLRPNIRGDLDRTAKWAAWPFVGDQMTHSGQKGFGMTKHGRSGYATRSPRFRFLQKLEAQKNDRKDRSRIKDPKLSVGEV
ncbi:hypothetical protein, partial [Bradyrhizobium sp. AUGA SZCCT0283]|uniref:hypothetical protein n=1 Tax=Bradyrhizobium sp. AUGA SZCCT0283 TaxID=2807671 RepID=UPI001BA9123F